MAQNYISSETHNWYMCQTWGAETQNLGFKTDDAPKKKSNYFAYLGTYVLFVEQPVVSMSLNNGPIQWLLEAGWEGQPAPIWKCMSGIGDPQFTFPLLPNYLFYTNLTLVFIGYFLTKNKASLLTFNVWKVEKNMQHRLMPV